MSEQTNKVKNICVYAASSTKIDKIYTDEAKKLGKLLSKADIQVFYGGGKVGSMGALADGVIEEGGRIKGIIPQFMIDEGWGNDQVEEIVTADIHSRKKKMLRLSDAAIALPGGIGTFEELLEAITWRQLGLFEGFIIIVNINGYYNNLLAMMETAKSNHFMRGGKEDLFLVVNNVDEAVNLITNGNAHQTVTIKRSDAQL